jgi:hypothetical protein
MHKQLREELEFIINEMDPLDAVGYATAGAMGIGAAGYGVYRRYFSKAAKACKGLEPGARRQCLKKYFEKVASAKMKEHKP